MMPLLNLLRHIYNFKKMRDLDVHQVRLLQRRRLNSLLRHVMTNSRFYRRYYSEHGITIDRVEDIELKDIPLIDKKIMMENFDDLVCDPALKKEELERFIMDPSNKGKKYKGSYTVIHTSGTSGRIGLFVYKDKELDIILAMDIARFSKSRINPLRKIKVVFFGAIDGNYAGVSLMRYVPRFVSKMIYLDILAPLEEVVRTLNDFQPELLVTYNSGAYILAQEQLKGSLNIRPKKITGSADPCTPKMRETIREAFGIEPFNCYLASESIGMAAECEYHDGLHLFDDWHCFEVLDKNMNPVSHGRLGNLVITTLYKCAQPLIRYKMSDLLGIEDTPCRCGWPFPRIIKFAGREYDSLWFTRSNGQREVLHYSIPGEFFVPGLKKIQYIQVSDNRLLLKAVVDGDPDESVAAIRSRMAEILKMKRLENEVSFDIELVDEINNDPKTGKFRLIIPLVG
ncbi:MAG TPA: hypothetical protein VM123_15455 [archaeon]|nr:hypothetical protein [archaeon]